jgi:hypothetical protein
MALCRRAENSEVVTRYSLLGPMFPGTLDTYTLHAYNVSKPEQRRGQTQP